MRAKEYLSQAFRLDQRINSKLEQVAYLKEMATKATVNLHAERVSGTRARSPMENVIVKLVALEQELNNDIDRLVDLKHEIAALIATIDKPDLRILLELRYLGCNKWEEVSAQMGYDLRWVHRLHGKALQEVEGRIEKCQ